MNTCCTGDCDQGRRCPQRECVSNVLQFQDRAGLHRHFAPGVIDGPHERVTKFDIAAMVVAYLAGLVLMAGILAIGYLGAELAYYYAAEAMALVGWKN